MAIAMRHGEMMEHLDQLALPDLEGRCREESQRAAQGDRDDGRYGYQLFHRALAAGDQAAWAAVERVYGGLIAAWARSHPLYTRAGADAEALTNQALVQLWRAVGPASFAAFPTLPSLLGYLQRCVHHLIIDQARAQVREERRVHRLGAALVSRGMPNAERQALERVQARELWALVRGHCRTDQEERVAYGYLVLGLKPRELLALWPEWFEDQGMIYRVWRTVLKRLRRSPLLQQARQDARAS